MMSRSRDGAVVAGLLVGLWGLGGLGGLGGLVGLGACDPAGRPQPPGGSPDAAVAPDAAAAADAAADAPIARTGFDVGYMSELTFPYNVTGAVAFIVIVNRGAMPLDLARIAAEVVSDDSPDVTWTLDVFTPSATVLPSGHAAGALSAPAKDALVTSGLVPEPLDDDTLDLELSPSKFPPLGVDVHAQAKIQIGNSGVTLPLTIHVVPDGMVGVSRATRVTTP